MSDDCAFCRLEGDPAPREAAHLTPAWRVTAHRSALAGWMLLMPRRHVESIADLTAAEAEELGPLLRAASEVHRREFGAEKTYVMQFAEGVRHVHFSLVPRLPDLPADRRGAAVAAYNSQDEPLGESERDEVAHRIAAAWPR